MGFGSQVKIKKACAMFFGNERITRQSNQSRTFVSGLSCGVVSTERGDVLTLRGDTAADVTRYKTEGIVRKQENVSTEVRLQWNLKEPALMVHLGAEMLAMQLVIRQLPPGLRPGFLMRWVC
jgi:DNA-binding helix-hairpin-helix protein with protein kinase domain